MLYSDTEELSYSPYEQGKLSYELDEPIISTGNDQLVFTSKNDEFTITAVLIDSKYLELVNGSYVWNLPQNSTEFIAKIKMNHESYGLGEFSLRGTVEYSPLPTWEDEESPFTVEYIQYSNSEALGYTANEQETFSYTLDGEVASTGIEQLHFTPRDESFEISKVMIAGQELPQVGNSFVWTLPEESTEFNATISMFSQDYGIADMTLRGNIEYEAPQGWGDIPYPLVIEYEIGEDEYARLPYTSQYEQGSMYLQFDEPITLEETSEFRIHPPSDQFTFESVIINFEDYAIEDNMVISFEVNPAYDQQIDMTITMKHSVLGIVTISAFIDIAREKPVDFYVGTEQMELADYRAVEYYMEGNADYDGYLSIGGDVASNYLWNLYIDPKNKTIVSLAYDNGQSQVEVLPNDNGDYIILLDKQGSVEYILTMLDERSQEKRYRIYMYIE